MFNPHPFPTCVSKSKQTTTLMASKVFAGLVLYLASGLAVAGAWEPSRVWDGEAPVNHFGFSLRGAGDVDGDGVGDWIVGAHRNSAGGFDSGRAYVYSGATGARLYTFQGEGAGDWFGFAVDGAGDVNGDGHADLIVGARRFDGPKGEESGKVYIYSGATGESIFTRTGEMAREHFGFAVAGAGDVDGDGYDDVIVGARGFGEPGKPRLGKVSVVSITKGRSLFEKVGQGPKNNFLGHSVASAGDVNHDGFADVIVGAPGTSTVPGYAEVYTFDATTGKEHRLHRLTDVERHYEFGHAVAGAGDLDGDGRADLIVGEPGAPGPDGGAETGQVYVFSGATREVLHANDRRLLFSGEGARQRFGSSVSGGRDLDGDGVPDLAVGAPFYDLPDRGPGQVSAYSGANGHRLLRLTGEAPPDRFGYSISMLEDINGDGQDDLLVGARDHRGPAGTRSGKAYLFLGPPPAGSFPEPRLHHLLGDEAGGLFGFAVAFADVDGDGIDEMAVGAPVRSCAAGLSCGRATLWSWDGSGWIAFSGGSTMIEGAPGDLLGFSIANAGRINTADGRCDGDALVLGAPQCVFGVPCQRKGKAYIYCHDRDDPANPWRLARELEGDQVGDFFGWAVAGAGNLNGPGNTDDVVVTAPGAFENRGKVVAFDDGDVGSVLATYRDESLAPGSLFGWSLAVGGVTDDFPGTEILIGAPGARVGERVIPAGYRGKAYVYPWRGGSPKFLEGEGVGDMFGFSVDRLTDVGGPGQHEEMVVGAPGFGGLRGKAYVFAPDNDTGLLYTLAGRPVSDEPVPADGFGYRVRGLGDVDGDGTGDLAVAAPYCEESACLGKGKVFLYSGDASVGAPNHWLRTLSNRRGHERDLFGLSLSAAPDLDGDGKPDLLIGAPRFEEGPDREQDFGALWSVAACRTAFGDAFDDDQLDRCKWKPGHAFNNTVQNGQRKGWIWEGTDGVLAAHFKTGPYTNCGTAFQAPFLYKRLSGSHWTVETEMEFQEQGGIWEGSGLFVRGAGANWFGVMAGSGGDRDTARWKQIVTSTSNGLTQTLIKGNSFSAGKDGLGACWDSTDRPDVPDLDPRRSGKLRAAVRIVRRGEHFDIFWKTADSEYELIKPQHTDTSCNATLCLPSLGDTVDLGYSGHGNQGPGASGKSFMMNAQHITGAIEDAFDNELLAVEQEPPFACKAGSDSGWCLENSDDPSFFEGTGGNLRIALTTAKSELRTRFFSAPHIALEGLGDTGDPALSGTRFDVESAMRSFRMNQETEGMYLIARKPGTFTWVGVRFWQDRDGLRITSLNNTFSEQETMAEQVLKGLRQVSARIRRDGDEFSFFYREEGATCWRELGTAQGGDERWDEVSFHLAANCSRCAGDLVADFDHLRPTQDTTLCE